MSNCYNSSFKNVSHYGDPLLMTELEVNFKHWMDWAFLGIGAWEQVSSSTSGIYGGSMSTLLPVEDAGYADNRVYFSIRKNWINETGVNYESPEIPVTNTTYDDDVGHTEVQLDRNSTFSNGDQVRFKSGEINNLYTLTNLQAFIVAVDETGEIPDTGTLNGIYNPVTPTVYVDGVAQTGTDFNIDYINGKVIFDSAQSSSATVTADYSFRSVQVYTADDAPGGFEIQSDSYDPTNYSWANSAVSGEYATDPSQRAQLPCVVIESIPNRTATGYELGAGTLRTRQDVLLTVIAQNKYERDNITDILASQEHKTITLYDIDEVTADGANPYTYEGYNNLTGDGLVYPDIVKQSQYFWSKAHIQNCAVNEIKSNSPELHMAKVRYSVEVIK